MNNSFEKLPEEYENDGNTYCHGIVNCKYYHDECVFMYMGSGNPDDMPCRVQEQSVISEFRKWKEEKEREEQNEVKGDLISREALKKAIEEVKDNYDGYEPNDLGKFMCKVDDLIDNAQAVEITEEMAINKLHETGWLIGHDKEMTTRPQGEWLFKHNSSDIWCSVCDENFDEIPQAFNFCPNCGADMRKGGAE